MSTNFPSNFDSFINPTPTNTLNAPSHSSQHDNINDSMSAVQTKIGVDNSSVVGSLDYKVNHLSVSSLVGIVPISKGGTNASVLGGANTILVGNGTSPVSSVFVGTSGQILTSNGAGTDPTFQTGSNAKLFSAFPALENITAGMPVSMGYSLTGLQSLDTKATGTVTCSGTSGTISFTVGNNTNRILIVTLACTTSDITAITALQFNGTGMTTLNSNTTGIGAISAYIMAPTTSTHNVTFTASSGKTYTYYVYSYFNVNQTALAAGDHTIFEGSLSGGATQTNTLTTSSDGALVFSAAMSGGGGGVSSPSTSIGFNENTSGGLAGDTYYVVPAQSVTVSATYSSVVSTGVLFSVAFYPLSAPSLGVVQASASPGLFNNFRTNEFIGFAQTTVSSVASVNITLAGIETSLSGLSDNAQYYLGSVQGTVSSVAGSVVGVLTRKVGISVSSVAMLITNIW